MTNVFALVLCCSTLALAIDTLHIPILTRERFPSQPSEKRTKVGLPADRSFARLMLCARLDCPCGPGLGEWDYTVRFFVTRPSGQFDSTGAPIPERIEIARFITPYAANRPSTWNWTWQWDVTDYRFLFSDSTDLIVQYQGWTQSALFTVWLDAIAGVPPYTVFALDQLIEGSFPYGKIDDPIDRYTTGKRFRVPPNAEMVQLRITTTGHGFGGTDNAAEFAEKIHTVVVGTTQFSQHLWRDDCGWNPVYPQDGTWPLSRAGWCPGDVVYPWQQWITSVVQPGTEATFDYRMQPFVNEQFDAHPSSYLVNAQVLYARRPALERRATLVAVRAPNAAPPHQRINPTCGHPQIVVRNDGRDSIASLRLEYTFDNGMPQQFLWRAPTPLRLSDTVTIELPSMTPQLDTPAVRRFTVRIADVNGQPNQEAVFDRMTVTFADVTTIPGDSVVVTFRTNRSARDQGLAWRLYRLDDGELAAERRNMDDNITDTAMLRLENGCYRFRFDNPAGYGLAWWATQQQLGSGSLWITANGKRVWTLDGDCGKGEIFDFRVGPVPQLNIQRDTIDFGATPVGMPVWRKRTIRPGTAAALQITHLQVSSFPANTGFRLVQTEPPLPPGGLWLRSSDSLVLTLEYSPPQEETRIRTATLTIVSNDYNEPNLRLLLRGTTPNVLEVAAPQMPMEWSVVPLPASDRVRIHTSISPTECWLVTLDGRAVHTPFIVDRTTVEIDCTSLSGGVYGAVVETVAGRVMVPIVVVR